MKKAFRTGDTVYYGVVKGTLLGIFNNDQCVFFAAGARNGFFSLEELLKCSREISNVLYFMIKDHFGKRTEQIKELLSQRRFRIVSLSELKHEQTFSGETRTEYQRLLDRRHQYLTMARHYMRGSHSSEKIHRICERIEETQLEIEARESKARQHLTGTASYE